MKTPRWTRLLLTWAAHDGDHDELIGDLEEVHRSRLARGSRLRAVLLTGGDAIAISCTTTFKRVRDAWSGSLMTGSEVRLALRLVLRNPIISITSVVALAVGIFLATTGFTVVDSIFNPRLPFPDADRFVEIQIRDSTTRERRALQPGLHRVWRAGATTLAHTGAAYAGSVNVRYETGEVELLQRATITSTSFQFLAFQPLNGRMLLPNDVQVGAEKVALISASLWERRFDGDPAITGARITLGSEPYTIVGVLPHKAAFPFVADVWLPMSSNDLDNPHTTDPMTLFGVLPPGTEPEAVEGQLTALIRDWASDRPTAGTLVVRAKRFGEVENGRSEGRLLIIVLVAILVVVAGNVANLIVARTASRVSELAVRTALGARRARLVAQLTAEVLLLGGAAAVIALSGSQYMLAAVAQSEAEDIPVWVDMTLGFRTTTFVIVVTLLVTLVAGVLPALRATRSDLAQHLRGGRGNTGRAFGWFSNATIIAQIALSIGILGGALMLHRGWARDYGGRDLGIPDDRIVSAQIELGPAQSKDSGGVSRLGLQNSIEEAMRNIDGVVEAGSGEHFPGTDAPMRPFEIETLGSEVQSTVYMPSAWIGHGYFETLDVQPLAGRTFRPDDYQDAAPATAVVNVPFVERYLMGGNAIGRRIRLVVPAGEAESPWREIVGVVPDLGLSASDPQRAGGVYLPSDESESYRLFVRTSVPPASLIRPLRQSVFSVDPAIAVSGVEVLAVTLSHLRRIYLAVGSVVTIIGSVVLLLSLMSIYAILSFEVTKRTREIGIRVALGATNNRIVQPILWRVVAYVTIGGAAGTALGIVLLLLARATLVMRFPPTGQATFPLLSAAALMASIVAAWVPTRRVLSIRPIEALQTD